jgi:hypothetical protein
MRNVEVTFLLLTLCAAPAFAGPCDAYFPFDGSLADASGNGYHGLPIVKEGEPRAPQFADGKIGQALHITAGNAMRAFIDLHYDFCPQVTITAWFRLASNDADGNQYIFSTGSGAGPGLYAIKTRLALSATGNPITQSDAVRDKNTWFFVAAVYDYKAGTYKLYWRRRVVEGKIAEKRGAPEDSFWVGAYNDRMDYLAQDLYIDDLRIQGKALSADDIYAIAADTSGATAQTIDAGTSALPACNTQDDCAAGSYCAWDNSCHPENHAPKRDLTFNLADSPLQTGRFIGNTDASDGEGSDYMTPSEIIADMRQQGQISAEAEAELTERIAESRPPIIRSDPTDDMSAAEIIASMGESTRLSPEEESTLAERIAESRPPVLEYESEEAALEAQRRREAAAAESSADSQPENDGTIRLGSDYVAIGISGISGEIVDRVDMEFFPINRISLWEMADKPCLLKVRNGDFSSTTIRCGATPALNLLKRIYRDGRWGVTALRVGRNIPELGFNYRVKGIWAEWTKFDDDGGLSNIKESDSFKLVNFDRWEQLVTCPDNHVATGLVGHFYPGRFPTQNTDRLTGLQLICREVLSGN